MRQINKSKQKISIVQSSPRNASISSFNNYDKKQLSVAIVTIKKLLSKTKNINIAIIVINAYYVA